MKTINQTLLALSALFAAVCAMPAHAQTARCDIPREARDIWHCENGFVIGPENMIIRLPIPETDPEALYNAGVEAANREDWRVAIAYFTAAHQRAHLVPRYMYNLGLAHAHAGHDLPAIAWLSAYLTAAPDADNRAAVWAEIAQHEARVQEIIDALWSLNQRAADSLPSTGSSNANARWIAYGFMADSALMLGGLDRARALLGARMAFCVGDDRGVTSDSFSSASCPQNVEADLVSHSYLEKMLWTALTQDFDVEAADVFNAQMGRDLESYPPSIRFYRDVALRERLVAPNWSSFFEPGYSRYGFVQHDTGWEPLEMARAGEIDALAQAARAHPSISSDDNLLLHAALREIDPLFASLSQAHNSGAEYLAAQAGEILLLVGDRASAERAAAESQRLTRADWNAAGYGSARLQALLAADAGRVDETLAHLEVVSSRLAVSYYPVSPEVFWLQIRHAPAAMLAEYLFNRGRTAEAFALAQRTDSMRRAGFYDSVLRRPGIDGDTRAQAVAALQLTLNDVAQGCRSCVDRRIGIENTVANANNLDGRYVDTAELLRIVAAGDGGLGQSVAISQQIAGLSNARRMIRALYRRSGGTWGQ